MGRGVWGPMVVFCGIDWSEQHHDVAIVDVDGKLVARRRVSDDLTGFAELVQVLAEAGDSAAAPIPVAIETSRGLLVACLRASGLPGQAQHQPADRPDRRWPPDLLGSGDPGVPSRYQVTVPAQHSLRACQQSEATQHVTG
jgi:hypothetical protein